MMSSLVAKTLYITGIMIACAWIVQMAFCFIEGRPAFALIGVIGLMISLRCIFSVRKYMRGAA